jgi:WS/DGAT/MGAT family acyltransferase
MSPAAPDRLTALDVAFLHIERDGLPIHVASVGIFEAGPLLDDAGHLRLDELRAQVEGRLDALPRLRRRVVWSPLGLTRPCWVDDPDFDVANHVDAVELPRAAGRDALRHYAEQLVAETLPLERPLWHLRFVTGLRGGRVGLIERVHHALVDGVSGVDVATVLLDLSPAVEPLVPSSWTPAHAPRPETLLLDGIWSQATAPARLARAAAGSLLHPMRIARLGADAAMALGTIALDGVTAPRSPINAPVGRGRRLAWITTDLAEVKQAGRIHRATANDVVLASVAHGLRALLLERGEVIAPDDVLKVLVPVSLRDEGQRGTLGNRVGALLLRLPIGVGDPIDRLQAIARTTERLKARREATTSALLLAGADLLPAPLLAPLARLTDEQQMVNVIVTNVPGPPIPLFCRGARMLDAYPVVPLGGNLAVGVALLSYDGRLNISLTADAQQMPDLERLRAGIEDGLAAVGATWRPPVQQPARPAPHATVAASA